MSDIIVFDSEQITVVYVRETKIIHHTIHKPVGGQPLRDALIAGSEAMRKYGACKWLSDDRKNGPLPQEDLVWSATFWQPYTIKNGWKYWALVVPTELVSAGTLTPVIESLYELGLCMMVFSTLEEAQEWLNAKPNTAMPEANQRAS